MNICIYKYICNYETVDQIEPVETQPCAAATLRSLETEQRRPAALHAVFN